MKSDQDQLRVPPHSVEAEQSVLGGLLLDNMAWDRAAELLTDSDFYRHEHRLIFSAISALVQRSRPADVVTVFEHLQGLGKAVDSGGLAYLNDLAQSVPSAANMRRYAEIVRERAVLRKLIAATDEIATAAFNREGREVRRVLDEAETKILAIAEETGRRAGGTFQEADRLIIQLLDEVNAMAERGASDVTGVRTGYYDLDRQTAGLQKGDLIVLAARPSMGKTAFALNIAEHVAVTDGLPVVIFSMEMGASQLMRRLAASVARIDQQNLRTAQLPDDAWGRLAEAAEVLGRARISIDESSGLTIAELRARARRKSRAVGGQLGLIVVDYLQLMSGAGEENRATEIGEISRGLKALAKDLKCPVIALSQLNRRVEERADKRPTMADIRESGAIEQDADVVMLLYRDDYYNADSRDPGFAELNIAKQRNGPVGVVRLAFLKTLTRFESAAMSAGGRPK